jgi:hypothetical protein
MSNLHLDNITRLAISALGRVAGTRALDTLSIDDALLTETGADVSRAAFAMALNVVLFHKLLSRVSSGAAYVEATVTNGGRVTFDHGALRTIRFAEGPTGALAAGQDAFAHILEPLGYAIAGTYPLPLLKMTGRAYRHLDAPEGIPQFFLSELHVERFNAEFGQAAARVFGTTSDPLDDRTRATLTLFAEQIPVPLAEAAHAIPIVAAAFDRHHEPATIKDYDILLAQSAEAAWIATEGNSFNHATDRVPDVDALSDSLKADGYPMKDVVEVSASGRVRQTAFLADSVERVFAGGVTRTVPGSFYEFITRAIDPETRTLDLRFDSGNATGIFAMTRAA